MATVQGLCEEATCSICRDYFREPVTLYCGHNFCRACLAGLWEGSGPDSPSCCPECKEAVQPRNFKPNQQLAKVVELLKKLQEGEGGGERKSAPGLGQWRMCQTHQEPLKLFCKDDEAPICVVCDRSTEHRQHRVFPMEEASQEYKEKIKSHLESLKDEREKLVEQKLAEELRRQECVAELEMEKQKIRIAFEKMQEFLEEKLNFWLGQLEDLEKEIGTWQEDNLARLSEEIAQLNELILEMEERILQPASEFLQDIRSALSRNQKSSAGQVPDLSPKMEEALRLASQKNSALEEALDSSQDSVKRALNKVSVTLDPDTSSPKLLLSEDLKSVRRSEKKQELPDNPERFDWMPFVLGREGFTSGRPWWEVEIEMVEKAMWAVGVAKDSVRRKGPFKLNPNDGVWVVKKQFGESSPFQLVALSCPEPVPVTVRQLPKKLRVSLDYEGGLVEFFDVDTRECIFAFSAGSFSGEKIRPFFHLGMGVNLKC